jgi:hypothetical protein
MHWRNVNYWMLTFLFGLIVPTLVGWFVVPPLKGTPLMGGPPDERPDPPILNRQARRHSPRRLAVLLDSLSASLPDRGIFRGPRTLGRSVRRISDAT